MSVFWFSSATLGVGIFMFFIAYRKSTSASVSESKKWDILGVAGTLITLMGISGFALDIVRVNQRNQEIWANVAVIKAETAKIEATTEAMETETAKIEATTEAMEAETAKIQASASERKTPTPDLFNP